MYAEAGWCVVVQFRGDKLGPHTSPLLPAYVGSLGIVQLRIVYGYYSTIPEKVNC